MKGHLVLTLLLVVSSVLQALPVKEKKEEHKEEEENEGEEHGEDWELNLEYGRYLKEVVQALESDPVFRKKLETAEVDDIKSGKIARELHFVDHNVRTQLDELKRRELERLRHLAIKEHEKEIGVDRNLLKAPLHIDHRNPTRFEVEDLKKLIVKTTEDLEKVDAQRQEEFKKYEMEKEYERQQQLAAMDEEHRKAAEEKHTEEVKKHAQHGKLHHPGSKQQLQEVWEEQDHMKADDFNPSTFFHLHDLDGNGYWDQVEVKILFQKELDKLYDPNASEDDMNERYEEMERMREHVFRESDVNRDNLISFEEFIEQTKKTEFEQDEGWKGLDEQEIYSQQEYEAYQRQRDEEIRKLVESGAIPPPPGYYGSPPVQPAVYQGGPHPGLHPIDAVGIPPPQAVPVYGVQPQFHPNAVPQGYQAVPQVYQAHPQGFQAVPPGYQVVQPGQAPPQGYHTISSGQAIPPGYQQVPQVVANNQAKTQGQAQAPVQYIPQESPYQVPAVATGGQQQPVVGQPVAGQPVAAQPALGQPVAGQPVAAQPQPVAGQPVAAQPVVGQPIAGQPVAAQPVVGQPVAAQPAPVQPVAAHPEQAQPIPGQIVPAQHVGGQPLAANQVAGQPISQQQIVNNIQGNAIH
ncbi:nucleobindin-2-like isoform X1 [Macrobrachium rosenbergii]|uniref:nucleobindin-2-like isoform X1 n=1 Tax=Macrobrachium rosenbergii TaxID=79674 RepID=UPI0034D6463C